MRNIDSKLNHTGTVEFNTQRLILRKITKQDSKDIFNKLAKEEDIIDFLSWNDNPSLEYTEKIVDNIIKQYDTQKATYNWLIETKKSKEVIGMILVDSYMEERLTAEIDYCIAKEVRGNGYASEALKRVIKYLIEDVGFFRIEAVHNMNNPTSGRVMEKAGMQYEGILRGKAISLNEKGFPDDLKLYSIIRTDL